MREVIEEAVQEGVDPDVIQAHAGLEDWDGLRAACAHKKRVKREVEEKRVASLTANLPPVEALKAVTAEVRAIRTALENGMPREGAGSP